MLYILYSLYYLSLIDVKHIILFEDINYSISTITSSGWDQSSEPSAGTIWITTVNYASDTTVTVQTEARTLTYDWVNWGDASITKSHQENAYTRTITRVWE